MESEEEPSNMLEPDVVLSMASPEAALCAFHKPSFLMGRTDASDVVQILALEVVLNEEWQTWFGELDAAANDETPVKQGSGHTENCCEEHEDVIAREPKYATKELVGNEMATLFKDVLDDVLRKKFQKAQSAVR